VKSASLHEHTGQQEGQKFLVSRSNADDGQGIGVYARGGCDLAAIFTCVPLIRRVTDASICLVHDDHIYDSRSDILLQGLVGCPDSITDPIVRRLDLPSGYFKPRLLDETLAIPLDDSPMVFPKRVIVLSIGPDVVRVAYRHRESGVLVDPGGIWLGKIDTAIRDPSMAQWFRDNFVSIGRINLEESVRNFETIITLIRQQIHAHVLVLNTLSPEPRGLTHNYQFVRDPIDVRRREFNLALIDLSRKLDFSIIDIDRVLQRSGIRDQEDWGHAHPRQHVAIGQELFRVMLELGVFDRHSNGAI
jgi:hypothetical protein